MKMPPNACESTDNGIYDFEASSLPIPTEEIENTPVDEFHAPPQNDFSEYLWMENEEEFDKEVMQRLEEEALMEECIAYMSNEGSSFQIPSEGSEGTTPVSNSKLNPEAAEFVPSDRREPPMEESPSGTTESP